MSKSTINSTHSTIKTGDGERHVTQYRTTVPKAIAEAMRLDGATIKWSVKGADALRVEVIAREGGDNDD